MLVGTGGGKGVLKDGGIWLDDARCDAGSAFITSSLMSFTGIKLKFILAAFSRFLKLSSCKKSVSSSQQEFS